MDHHLWVPGLTDLDTEGYKDIASLSPEVRMESETWTPAGKFKEAIQDHQLGLAPSEEQQILILHP